MDEAKYGGTHLQSQYLEDREESLWIRGQSGLHSKVYDSQGYSETLSQINRQTDRQTDWQKES